MARQILRSVIGRLLGLDAQDNLVLGGSKIYYSHDTNTDAVFDLTVGAGSAITALTSDVTASGPGSAAATIANNAVTNAKAAQMAANTVKGNNTGGLANAADLTATQLTALINPVTTALKGVAPASGGGIVNFLRADATWASPVGSGASGSSGVAMNSAATYAVARTMVGTANGDTLYVFGRTANTDGGQGLFTWVAGGTTTVDDGFELQGTGGTWRRPEVTIRAETFGCDLTGVVACDVALNKAIQQAIAFHLKLVLPGGIFLLSLPLLLFVPGTNNQTKIEIEGQGGVSLSAGGSTPPTGTLTQFEANTVLVINSKLIPAVILQYNRYSVLRNISIMGLNTTGINAPSNPTDNTADYILAGCAVGVQSPYCAIAIDPFTTSVPADGGYTGLGAYYGAGPANNGSSGMLFDNIGIEGFVVGIAISTAGVSQGDVLTFRNLNIQYCDTAVAGGNSQSRNVHFSGGNISYCRQAFDYLNYGAPGSQPCNPILIEKINSVHIYRLFALHNYTPCTILGYYGEMCKGLGQFGKSATNGVNCTFIGCDLSLPDLLYPPLPAYVFESYGPTVFKGCNFRSESPPRDVYNFICQSGGGNQWSTGTSFEQCTFRGTAYFDLPPYIGLDVNGVWGAHFKDCKVTNSAAGDFAITDDYPMVAGSGIAINGRLRATFTTRTVPSLSLNNPVNYDYQLPFYTPYASIACTGGTIVKGTTAYTITGITKASNAVVTVSTASSTNPFNVGNMVAFASVVGMTQINGLSAGVTAIGGSSGAWTVSVAIDSTAFSTYSSAGTATLDTLAFTIATLGEVLVNDILFWTMLAEGYSTNQYTVPAWKVNFVNAGTGAGTATPLYNITHYDTVANNPSNVIYPVFHQWAPTQAVTGNTHSNTTLDSVSPTALRNGDWVSASGLPANTRVVSGGGTASLVLSKASGTTLTGTRLWHGQLLLRTTTVAF